MYESTHRRKRLMITFARPGRVEEYDTAHRQGRKDQCGSENLRDLMFMAAPTP